MRTNSTRWRWPACSSTRRSGWSSMRYWILWMTGSSIGSLKYLPATCRIAASFTSDAAMRINSFRGCCIWSSIRRPKNYYHLARNLLLLVQRQVRWLSENFPPGDDNDERSEICQGPQRQPSEPGRYHRPARRGIARGGAKANLWLFLAGVASGEWFGAGPVQDRGGTYGRFSDRRWFGIRGDGSHRRRRARLGHPSGGCGAHRAYAGSAGQSDLLSRRFSALHERAHRRHHSLYPQGRRWRSGRDFVLDHGASVCARIFQPRHARGVQDPRPGELYVERRGMGLVLGRRTPRAQMALEPEQRLGTGLGHPRVE